MKILCPYTGLAHIYLLLLAITLCHEVSKSKVITLSTLP